MNGDAEVEAALRRSRAEVGLSTIVLFELMYGALRSARLEANVRRIEDLPFKIIGFGQSDARCAAQVRASLAAVGTPIGPYDMLIAGQALARDLILVTHNTREFARVPGLRLEDWQA